MEKESKRVVVTKAVKRYVEAYLYQKMRRLTILGIILTLLSAVIVLGAYIAAGCAAFLFPEHRILSVLCCVLLIYDFDMLTYTRTQHALIKFLHSDDTSDTKDGRTVSNAMLAIFSSILVIYVFVKNLAPVQTSDVTTPYSLLYQFYLLIPLFIMTIGFGIQRLADRQYLKLMQCMQVDLDNIEIEIQE